MSVKRSAATSFVLITVLIDSIGFGIIIPVMPSLISELAHVDTSGAARYGGFLFAAYAVMQFLFSPVVGGLSDQYGRRPVLLASLLGFGLDYVLLIFAPTIGWLFSPVVGGLSDQYGRRPVLLASLLGFGLDYVLLIFAPTIGWLFVGRLIAGIMGASFTTAAAYMADISVPEKRAQNFGMIGAAFGLGFIIGPSIGAVASHYGTRVPFMIAGVLTLLNWLYGYFVLPESLKMENRRKFDWKRANPVGALLSLRRFPMLTGLVTALFLVYISSFSTQGTWTYFTKERFNWSDQEIGWSLTFVGFMIALVQGGLTRILIPKLGTKNSIYVGFIFSIFGSLAYTFANESWMMYAIMVPFSLGGLAGPAMQGIISSQIPANEQGELQGALTSLNSVASIVGPVLMTTLFYRFTAKDAPVYFPGVPFLASVILTLISFLLIIRTLNKDKQAEESTGIKHSNIS